MCAQAGDSPASDYRHTTPYLLGASLLLWKMSTHLRQSIILTFLLYNYLCKPSRLAICHLSVESMKTYSDIKKVCPPRKQSFSLVEMVLYKSALL